ncbi:sporulation transcriptional regulator SpoIIID [uncultured Ruminococcus sp.]|uniref:sporulation transcriptional regulator SpoIIID n=1 Tax=uncultured Ruminococcus sp. TaxID=165186 RepID=UPI0025DA73DF|nr:sporulation transcriptional regulator SpoIIID [uncultured Ruminococcus sp.]
MVESDKERPVIFGEYMVSRRTTVRATAKAFGVSKSTVHKDLSERLPGISPALYAKVKEILEENKQQRHIRGGLATKHKYEEQHLLAVNAANAAKKQKI